MWGKNQFRGKKIKNKSNNNKLQKKKKEKKKKKKKKKKKRTGKKKQAYWLSRKFKQEHFEFHYECEKIK